MAGDGGRWGKMVGDGGSMVVQVHAVHLVRVRVRVSGRWREMAGDGGRWWEMAGDGGRWRQHVREVHAAHHGEGPDG